MLDLIEITDQLVMANSVLRYGHVMRREDGHVMRWGFDFVVEDLRKKWRPRRTWEK